MWAVERAACPGGVRRPAPGEPLPAQATDPEEDAVRFTALSQIVPSPEDFAANPPTRPQVWSMPPEPLRRLLDHAGIDRMLRTGVPAAAFRAVRDGRGVDPAEYVWGERPIERPFADTVRPGAVGTLLRDGSTIVLDVLHRFWEPVGDFCRRLGHEVGLPASATGFITPADQPGFPYHHDEGGNLLIQTSGSKTWRVHEATAPDPLPHETLRRNRPDEAVSARLAQRPPALETTLRPGDVLWIPRGWLHSGIATGEPSVHVAVGFVPVLTRYWLAGKLAERLDERRPEFAGFRRELPWGITRSPGELAAVLAEVAKELAEALPLVDAAGLADSLVRDVRKNFLEPPGTPTVSATADPTGPTTPVVLVPEAVAGVERADAGRLRLHLGSTTLTLRGAVADHIEDLWSADGGERWCAHDIAPLAGEAAALDLVRTLLRLGVARRADAG
ncbi:JmjC domain-containing protein [Kitasatospora sp. NPDC058162]|uniref:JmjC domain-containing protein n=1 Tax=Kitasatospora sp. NPDC058162 TaxID=3346362 RepID=UPI0036DD8A40